VTSEFQLLTDQLGAIVARNTATAVADRIRLRRAGKQDAQTIAELEEIVNDLIDDKNEVIRIAHAFEENLVAQQLTESDLKYLTDHFLPSLRSFVEQIPESALSAGSSDQVLAGLEAIKPLVSPEALTILQMIGFNFKRAIGEPLTGVVESLITSRARPSANTQKDLQALSLERENLVFKIALDADAHARLLQLTGRSVPAGPLTGV
jgi:hypothetical protein